MQAGRQVAQQRIARKRKAQGKRRRQNNRRRQANDHVPPARIHNALGAGIDHACLEVRPKGHARTGRRKQLKEHRMHQLVYGKRRHRDRSQADCPAHDRRQATRVSRIQVRGSTQQHEHRHQAHGKCAEHDHPPHKAGVQKNLVLKRMYVGNLIHSILG